MNIQIWLLIFVLISGAGLILLNHVLRQAHKDLNGLKKIIREIPMINFGSTGNRRSIQLTNDQIQQIEKNGYCDVRYDDFAKRITKKDVFTVYVEIA